MTIHISSMSSHDFKYLVLSMSMQDATELISMLSEQISEVSRGKYNAGFYSEKTTHFNDESGYPSYLNELCLRIDKK
jgi:hypothetical protein